MRRYYLGPYADKHFREGIKREVKRPIRLALSALPLAFVLGIIVERYFVG